MKKVIFSVAVLVTAAIGVMKVTQSDIQLSNLQMENIEALAQSECMDPHVEIGRPCCTSLCGCCNYGYDEIDGRFI